MLVVGITRPYIVNRVAVRVHAQIRVVPLFDLVVFGWRNTRRTPRLPRRVIRSILAVIAETVLVGGAVHAQVPKHYTRLARQPAMGGIMAAIELRLACAENAELVPFALIVAVE